MDQHDSVNLVEEEEKFGWTVLSTVPGDGELDISKQVPLTPQTSDPVSEARSDEAHMALTQPQEETCTLDEDTDDKESVGDGHDEENDADDEHEDYEPDASGDDDTEMFLATSGLVAEQGPSGEAYPQKEDLSRQPAQKQGLMWRASLVATLGFFGWILMTGLSGCGKNLRCHKLHPCSIKEGEPILTTL